jgi:nicotinamidase-related amidase
MDIYRRGTLRQPPPVLLCVDMQQEHLTPGRRHVVSDVATVLDACTMVRNYWRASAWPVVHLKRVAQAAWFNPASSLTDWLPDCRPLPGEMIFEHPLPSAYSSPRMSEYLTNLGITSCVLIGFSLEEAVLSTVIEGFHRGHNLRVIADAVACAPREDCDAAIHRKVLTGLVMDYAAVETLETILPPAGVGSGEAS